MNESIIADQKPYSSVEISTDSKGNPKLTVKAYSLDVSEAFSLAFDVYQRGRMALDVMMEERQLDEGQYD